MGSATVRIALVKLGNIARAQRLAKEQAAARCGTSLSRYVAWERGEQAVPHVPKVGKMKRHERFTLLRRRAGVTQRDIAVSLGCSRRWVTMMEKGRVPSRQLEEYWGV